MKFHVFKGLLIYRIVFTLFFLACIQVSISQNIQRRTDSISEDKIFKLGDVTVVGKMYNELNNKISSNKMEKSTALDVSHALNVLPGITLTSVGARNESMVYIRGFDLRQVPLYLDGVPVYVPYDGYVDLARFTTFDLAEIKVDKGFSSVIYGPNSLGGAINLITKKTSKKFELNGITGWRSGGYRTNFNMGSNLGKFYVQAGISRLNRDYFKLSDNFTPTKNENGGKRDNSYSNDEKINLKIAFTPTKNSEYAVSFVKQHGTKGTPVYAGSDTLNSLLKSPRFWQWPKWDKQSIYFISNTKFSSESYFKTRIYYDQFINTLFSFDDSTYTTQKKGYSFQSYYNDYTVGGSAEYGTSVIAKNELKFAFHYKKDVHRENNLNEPVREMADQVFSFSSEDSYAFNTKFSATGGVNLNVRNSLVAQDYNSTTKLVSNFPSNSNSAFNIQAGLFYRVSAAGKVFVTVAKKTRFATTKDRYSYKMGTAIPNPDLKAENAVNYELGYTDVLFKKLKLQSSLFYSNLHNVIQSVNNVKYDTTQRKWLSQEQNTQKAEYYGAEVGVDYSAFNNLAIGFNYTYLRQNNLSNSAVKFTNVPDHKVFGYVQFGLFKAAYLLASIEYNSKRYSTTYGAISKEFSLVNIKGHTSLWKYFSAEAGMNNAFDKNYTLTEGYPEQGRNYFINFIYNY